MISFCLCSIIFIKVHPLILEKKTEQYRLKKANQDIEEIQMQQFNNFRKIIHDIKHPIHEIVCLLQVMKFENDKDSFETYSNILHEIAKTLIGRIETIKDMNSLLTIEQLKMTETNLLDYFTKMLYSFSFIFHLNDRVKYLYTIEIPNELTLNFDEDRYRRCIENLVNNAIKYTAEGNVSIRIYTKDMFLYTEVQDTGKGIATNQIDEVLNGKQLQKGTGTGMGLPFVSSYLNLVNGKIEIVSEENFGTLVKIYVPIKNTNETLIDIDIPDENFKVYKMLLVDDCAISRNIIPKLFMNIGNICGIKFEVTTADNGETGLKLLKQNEYDLVFSDYWMPIMDGETMINKFITHKPKSNTLIKLYSANVFDNQKRKYDVLKKPISNENIQDIINELKVK